MHVCFFLFIPYTLGQLSYVLIKEKLKRQVLGYLALERCWVRHPLQKIWNLFLKINFNKGGGRSFYVICQTDNHLIAEKFPIFIQITQLVLKYMVTINSLI